MKLPKKGKVLRQGGRGSSRPIDYSQAISSALRSELGDTHRATKTVMKWTGASERAVKNWLSGERGPHGRYLIQILRYSDGTLQTVLAASRRVDLLEHFLQQKGSGSTPERERYGPAWRVDDDGRYRLPRIDPDRDPIHDPDRDPNRPAPDDLSLNDRQRWFLTAVGDERRVSARTIQNVFNVSEKTAKRDIASLKTKELVQFIGTRRRGRYVLLRP